MNKEEKTNQPMIELSKQKWKEESELLSWWLSQIKNYSYSSPLEYEKLNEFIQKIITWYEIKYPDYILEMKKNNDKKLAYLKDITKELNFEQLKLRLSPEERKVLNGHYRSNLDSKHQNSNPSIFAITLKIQQEESNKEITFFADELGIIERCNLHNLEKYLKPFKGSTTLIRVFNELKKTSPYIEMKELEKCIKTHEIDLDLRDRIISFTSLFLLSSPNHPLEYNYTRALALIKEYNDFYWRNLSTKFLQKFMIASTSKENKPISKVRQKGVRKI